MTKVKHAVAKVQHYVPKFLLKNFRTGKKGHLRVFDKRTGATFIANARNVASESRFYDFKFEGETLTLEPGLSKLEGAAKPLFEKLLKRDSLGSLSDDDRGVLGAFFAVQFTRTRAFLEQWHSIGNMLAGKMREWASTDEERASVEEYLGVRDPERDKMEFARIVAAAPQTYGHRFVNKTWVLLKTERSRPFIIGDNPLALQNSIDMSPRGNVGLGVVGIEICCPLSPTRALAMWCPSLVQALAARPDHWATIDGMLSAIEAGEPLPSDKDNILNFNSLQIRYAERYVFSSVDDFRLAREMVEDPEMRIGPRPRVV